MLNIDILSKYKNGSLYFKSIRKLKIVKISDYVFFSLSFAFNIYFCLANSYASIYSEMSFVVNVVAHKMFADTLKKLSKVRYGINFILPGAGVLPMPTKLYIVNHLTIVP